MVAYEYDLVEVPLRHDQVQALAALAQKRGESIATLVQRGVDGVISDLSHVAATTPPEADAATQAADEAAIRRLTGMFSANVPEADDENPLGDIIGMATSGVSDLAAEHDHYLMQFEEEDNRSWLRKSS